MRIKVILSLVSVFILFGAGCGRQTIPYASIKPSLPALPTPIVSTESSPNEVSSIKIDTTKWKIFKDEHIGFELKYPADVLSVDVKADSNSVALYHTIPWDEGPIPCDERDDAPVIKTIRDVDFKFMLMRENLKVAVSKIEGSDYIVNNFWRNSELQLSPGFIDAFANNELKGYKVISGVEGCGIVNYYFPLKEDLVLTVRRPFGIFSEIVGPEVKAERGEILGIINPDKEEQIFNEIISSFKLYKNL